jgi:hypothetical protein
MEEKCRKFYNEIVDLEPPALPFNFKKVFKRGHVCPWLHKGCTSQTKDCSNLSGYFIEIDKPVTTADVRVIKWLTGMTVCSDFVDNTQLSSEWEAK